ncbi:MAG: triose-phosphate isomerase [Acidobacteriota bacterium]
MKSSPPFVAGNWKMNLTIPEAKDLATAVVRASPDLAEAEIVIAPPFTALSEVRKILEGSSVQLAAQNVFWEENGAFTGEISPLMLKEAGCQYVIIGHSERRQYFHELDGDVNKKVKAALRHGISPLLCIGETLEERERGATMDRISEQIQGGLEGISAEDARRLIIAYEPIWAIGTGRTASPGQAEEVHEFIREEFAQRYGNGVAGCAIILYGGSVKPANSYALLREKNIDGFLVGGASLEAESFIQITKEAIKAHKEKT